MIGIYLAVHSCNKDQEWAEYKNYDQSMSFAHSKEIQGEKDDNTKRYYNLCKLRFANKLILKYIFKSYQVSLNQIYSILPI